MSEISSAGFVALLDLDFSPVSLSLSVCVMGGTKLSMWHLQTLHWGLNPLPRGYFWFLAASDCTHSTMEQSVCSIWRTWREGINTKITGGNWTPRNVRAGWDRKDRRGAKYTPPFKVPHSYTHKQIHTPVASISHNTVIQIAVNAAFV